LVSPPPAFRQQCEDAATSLGYAVPCPRRVPLIGGQPIDCSGDCIAALGGDETFDTIFFLNVEEYDSDDSAAVRHLIIEARKIERAPSNPCYDGVPAGGFDTNGRMLALLDCPPSTPKSQGA